MLSQVHSNIVAAQQRQQVKTVLRVRPFLATEKESQGTCLKVVDDRTVLITNYRNERESFAYTFDRCFDTTCRQVQVFDEVSSVVDKIWEFRNATIFAYGITGAGKTFTMDGGKAEESYGVIHRAAKRIIEELHRRTKLNRLMDSSEQESFELRMSHLEIYNEKVYDLATTSRNELFIRQDGDGNIVVADLTEKPLSTLQEFEQHYKYTKENRFTASTLLNAASSRSHSVLKFSLTRSRRNKYVTTKLHLIDLAGSEDNRKTGNSKDRMIESGNINKSLFMLNQVVDALNSNAINIPYRNSKLTRLLQDSLGGKSEALMITNVAPSNNFYLDTLNTLNMAQRTRKVVNQSVVQPVASSQVNKVPVGRKSDPIAAPIIKKSLVAKPLLTSLKNIPSIKPPVVTTSKDKEHPGIDIDTLLVNATPNTKKGIMKALKRSEEQVARLSDETQQQASRKRKLNDLLASYPLKLAKTVKEDTWEDESFVVESEASTNLENESPQKPNPRRNSKPKTATTEPVLPVDVNEVKQEYKDRLLAILNGSNVKDITTLKGIGVNRAQSIVDYFHQNGPFTSVEDLMNVGIGKKVLHKLVEDFVVKVAI